MRKLWPLVAIAAASGLFADQQGPDTLTYDEIIQLYQQDAPPAPLAAKLHRLLNTPFVNNDASNSGVVPVKPVVRQLGPVLRVVQWNIERGLEFDAVRFAFSDEKKFAAAMEDKSSKADEATMQKVKEQIALLKDADVIVLNEVDWGLNRTLFRNVGEELAKALTMNYCYGVEFVEVDPVTMGLDQDVMIREVKETYAEPDDKRSDIVERVKQIMAPDPGRYLGLHGTAILSRYPLRSVKLIPFQNQGHDWYADEKKKSSGFAKMQGKAGSVVFKEQVLRQVRRGGRMMLVADIVSEDLPSKEVTIVATHLEDESTPAARRKQLDEILQQIAEVQHPVILAGDMNTSTHDGVPTTIGRLFKDHFGSAKWWAEEGVVNAINYTTPYGLAATASKTVVGLIRSVDDPTEKSIPLMGTNPEAKFFSDLEDFRFEDGGRFDFSGETERSANGRVGKLANSNERGEKGFIPTNELGKKYGPVGQFKLDWIFVKPAKLADSSGHEPSYAFTPCFGRTLRELNHSFPDRISDHSPILVDLPLGQRTQGSTSVSSR